MKFSPKGVILMKKYGDLAKILCPLMLALLAFHAISCIIFATKGVTNRAISEIFFVAMSYFYYLSLKRIDANDGKSSRETAGIFAAGIVCFAVAEIISHL